MLSWLQTDDNRIDYSNKLHIVDEFAKRWWYALPLWPPVNFDYESEINKRGYEVVEAKNIREPSK